MAELTSDSATPAERPPRDAATVILLRDVGLGPDAARVLMGQRGGGARFMPNKVVFPGGAVDSEDFRVSTDSALADECQSRLARDVSASDPHGLARALGLAAIRETFEETGLRLARSAATPFAPPDGSASWTSFAADGRAPALDRLRFVFRAVTPPGLPVRFDARFFVADAGDLDGDPDDFTGASDELGQLRWFSLADARALPLPFITSVVLAELRDAVAAVSDRDAPNAHDLWDARPVPFFRHGPEGSWFDPL